MQFGEQVKKWASECGCRWYRRKNDVVEVKHGMWIYKGISDWCSVCGRWLVIEQGTADMNYCPHCGAKMDGDKNG